MKSRENLETFGMNYGLTVNMKCFEITMALKRSGIILSLTVNMKCFEILQLRVLKIISYIINCKHEMFWNAVGKHDGDFPIALTVNMKCFEIIKL